jgi:hypothetical protein
VTALGVLVAGGGVDRGGAGPGGDPVDFDESSHITDIGQDPGGAGQADGVNAINSDPGA